MPGPGNTRHCCVAGRSLAARLLRASSSAYAEQLTRAGYRVVDREHLGGLREEWERLRAANDPAAARTLGSKFLVQFLVLKHASEYPAVIHYPDNIRQLGTLAAAGCLSESVVLQLQDIYKAYRLRLHRLALDEQPPLVANDAFPEEREFVSKVWERELQ